ncbi:hypothetical protein MQE36_11710 [Zhouia spongiae]|uniref:Uncharacterized protein n=1 Tax=Zhouia spongiae TaxID=2202721 RepID=A0ABY3YJC9_9FLAO|nr:hypothetical protein [Zhouia spongiae]UNY97750.1 hypothetical protein MQE36_11710 [Zhouia spongiae]
MTYNQLGFAFTGLRTVSFAIIDTAYKKTGETNLITGLGFGLDIDDHIVTCNTRFSFEKKKGQPFLLLEVQATFEIEKNDFLSKIKQGEHKYIVKKNLAVHFAVLTIGSARGILHAKTDGTPFNEFILPTIDVNNMLQEDVRFEF